MVDMLLLHHCNLNMNVRAPGISVWRGVVEVVLEALYANRPKFIQLPCPEAVYLGLRRWWFVKEQYDNAMYRSFCRKLASSVADILRMEDVSSVKLVGLGLSPSCAYRETQSDGSWGGKPRDVDFSKNVKTGMGVWSEELVKALEAFHASYYDLPPPLIYPGKRGEHTSLYPKTLEQAFAETAAELGLNPSTIDLKKYSFLKAVDEDLRSGRNIVAPLEMAYEESGELNRFIEEGYGLVLIPEFRTANESTEFYLDVMATQVENQARAGQTVAAVPPHGEKTRSYSRFVQLLVDRKAIPIEFTSKPRTSE